MKAGHRCEACVIGTWCIEHGPSGDAFIVLEFDHIHKLIIHWAGTCRKLVKMGKFLTIKAVTPEFQLSER